MPNPTVETTMWVLGKLKCLLKWQQTTGTPRCSISQDKVIYPEVVVSRLLNKSVSLTHKKSTVIPNLNCRRLQLLKKTFLIQV